MDVTEGNLPKTLQTKDIFIFDEWLSVGDSNFQKRANERLNEMVDQSSLVVFASHNADFVKSFSSRTILLDRGRLVE